MKIAVVRSNIVANRDFIFLVNDKMLERYSRHTMQKINEVDISIYNSNCNSVLFIMNNLLVMNNEVDYPAVVSISNQFFAPEVLPLELEVVNSRNPHKILYLPFETFGRALAAFFRLILDFNFDGYILDKMLTFLLQ